MKQRNRPKSNSRKKPLSQEQQPSEKLQKILARLGLGSRREIETWISEGRVNVNGKTAKVGDRANLSDRIKLNGKTIFLKPDLPRTRVLIYHKPAGVMCTRKDPQGRPTVYDNNRQLNYQRWIMVGRLDFNTSGLLLFTNDGEFANKLLHPSSEIEREYAVRLPGIVSESSIKNLSAGVMLEDGLGKFESIIDAGGTEKNHWYHVILKEGRNREVRRLWESQGYIVSRLIRIRFGNITLPRDLRMGKVRELTDMEIKELATSKI